MQCLPIWGILKTECGRIRTDTETAQKRELTMNNEIVWLTTSLTNQNNLNTFFRHNGISLPVIKTDCDSCIRNVRELEKSGTRVIICKGELEHIITNNTSSVVVPFRNPLPQFYRAIKTASQFSCKVALVGWYKNVIGLKEFCEIIDPGLVYVELEDYEIHSNPQNVDNIILSLENQGIDAVVGNEMVITCAKRLGIPAYSIGLNPQAIFDTVSAAERQLSLLEEQQRRYQFINTLVNSVSEGIITVNPQLEITNMNRVALDILGISSCSWQGNRLTDWLSFGPINRTLSDGYKIVNQIIVRNGVRLLLSASPITDPSSGSGAVIILQKIDNLLGLERTIRKMSIEKNLLAKKTFDDIVGSSPVICRTKETARLYARTNSTILITGESGVGKELFAQGIHNESSRRDGPFLAFNCGAVSESLLESELFGYVKGAFTGASSEGKIGIFEQAHQGTLFLDEISELSPSAQIRLLRVLQEREITRIGETKVTPVDVRIIAACNKNLLEEVELGRFRRDLYYRIYVLHLDIPPLRVRGQDIMELIFFFLKTHHQDGLTFSPEACQTLLSYSWPGNIRELNNFTERLSVLFSGCRHILQIPDILPLLTMEPSPDHLSRTPAPYVRRRRTLDREQILKTLEECGGNRRAAAGRLGISTTTLWRKLKKMES